MTEDNIKSLGANALSLAMIAGAALLFLEITWSPMMQAGPARTATVQTLPIIGQPGRVAANP